MNRTILRLYNLFFLFALFIYSADGYIDYTLKLSKGDAKQVQIEGDFTGWVRISMEKSGKVWMKTFKLKPNRMYEYRFIVDNVVESDPDCKNKFAVSSNCILFLNLSGQEMEIDKKDMSHKLIREIMDELLGNQKKFLEELELLRNEIVKKDLQIELLRTRLDKSDTERKEKEEALHTIELQYEQLSKKLREIETDSKKMQERAEAAKKDYKNMQNNYFNCLKSTEKLKKHIKSVENRCRKKRESTTKKPPVSDTKNDEHYGDKNSSDSTKKAQAKMSYVKVGKIYEVSETSNLVVIYLEATSNNLSTGDILYVLQNNEVKATLAITSIEKDWCYAKVVSGNKNDVKNSDVYVESLAK